MLVEFGDADKAVTFLLDVARQGGVTDSPYIWFEVSKLWLHHLNQVERALAGFCRANTLNSWNPDIWGNIYTRFTIPWHLIILPPLFFFLRVRVCLTAYLAITCLKMERYDDATMAFENSLHKGSQDTRVVLELARAWKA